MDGIAKNEDGGAAWKFRCRRSLKRMGKWTVNGIGSISRLLGGHAGGAFGILIYHRVTPRPAGAPAPTWNVTPTDLRAQLKGLLTCGYRAWPLRKVLDFNRQGRPIPPRTFVVTFDDGYENNYSQAWPVLRELEVPATIFVATAYLDGVAPFPCDDWPAAGSPDVPVDSWRPLTTRQCAEMLEHGLIDLGSHTHTHDCFRGRPEAFAQDVAASLDVLRTRFGLTDATFAFPFGIVEPALVAAARRAGLLCALSSRDQLNPPHSDPFTWGRLTAEESDTDSILATKLDGWYSRARGAWRRLLGSAMADEQTSAAPAEAL
jgi:peptidoglycan/xylan/chitin deacetylase (PgdA/CDA1 family)